MSSPFVLLALCLSLLFTCCLCLNNGLGLSPQMGWNEYNFYHNKLNETIVQQTALRMIELGLVKLGYNYINLDDCWQIDRDKNTGVIIVDPSQFPSGIAPLAEFVHLLGMKFGLYSDAGTKTCEGRPGSLGYETMDAATYAEWQVDYLKYDNCNAQGIDPKLRYPVMRDALNHTGRHILFAMCEWGQENPAEWAPLVGNSWRTTGDISDSWKSMIGNVRTNDEYWNYAGPGGWNDPDMLEIDTHGGMTQIEQQTHFSLWSIMKSPLILGMDILNISAGALEIITNAEVIALNQDPLGVQAHQINRADNTTKEVWAGALMNGDVAAMLLNSGTEASDITMTWDQLGIGMTTPAVVRDLWMHQDIGTFTGSFTGTMIPSHGSLTLRVSPQKPTDVKARLRRLKNAAFN